MTLTSMLTQREPRKQFDGLHSPVFEFQLGAHVRAASGCSVLTLRHGMGFLSFSLPGQPFPARSRVMFGTQHVQVIVPSKHTLTLDRRFMTTAVASFFHGAMSVLYCQELSHSKWDDWFPCACKLAQRLALKSR